MLCLLKTHIMKKSYFTLVFLFLLTNIYSQTTYIPDDNFEQALINLGYDTGTLDDFVPTANIITISYLDVSKKNISNLTGIKDFINLQVLICSNNLLNNLDVRHNTALVHLEYYNNKLCDIDIKQNTKLDLFHRYDNQLVNLFSHRR